MLGCETPGKPLADPLAMVGAVGADTGRGDEQWRAAVVTLFGRVKPE